MWCVHVLCIFLLVVGGCSQGVGWRLFFVVCCLVAVCVFFAVSCLLFLACRAVIVVCCAVDCVMIDVCGLLFVVCLLLFEFWCVL